MVRSAHLEPGQTATRVAPALAEELRDVQTWLGLDDIEVGDQGDLAGKLRSTVRNRWGRKPVGQR
jgi:hypothetical protein